MKPGWMSMLFEAYKVLYFKAFWLQILRRITLLSSFHFQLEIAFIVQLNLNDHTLVISGSQSACFEMVLNWTLIVFGYTFYDVLVYIHLFIYNYKMHS